MRSSLRRSAPTRRWGLAAWRDVDAQLCARRRRRGAVAEELLLTEVPPRSRGRARAAGARAGKLTRSGGAGASGRAATTYSRRWRTMRGWTTSRPTRGVAAARRRAPRRRGGRAPLACLDRLGCRSRRAAELALARLVRVREISGCDHDPKPPARKNRTRAAATPGAQVTSRRVHIEGTPILVRRRTDREACFVSHADVDDPPRPPAGHRHRATLKLLPKLRGRALAVRMAAPSRWARCAWSCSPRLCVGAASLA